MMVDNRRIFFDGSRLSGNPRGIPHWSKDAGSCPAREGEAGSPDKGQATIGRRNVKQFPLQARLLRRIES